jgi:SSS family transporter
MLVGLAVAPFDLAVVFLYLGAVVAFGLWVGRGQRDMTGYLLGGRDVPWWALLGSIVATETSTATFLSIPGSTFAGPVAEGAILDPNQGGDLRFLQLALGLVIGRCLIVSVLLPLFFRGKLFTAYEVLHQRFGGPTQKVASLVFLVARNLGDGLRLLLTAIVLQQIIGISLAPCIVAVGLVTIGYTFLGGIKSVIWTDCVQFVVYVGGGLAALLFILMKLPDGWSGFCAFAESSDKLRCWDFSWDPHLRYTFWSGLVGGAFLTLGTHGTDQIMVQRYLCARNEREAGWAVVSSGIVVLLQFLLFLVVGVALAAYYVQVAPGVEFRNSDSVFSYFIVHEMPQGVGLVGILLAAIFSVAMSTQSSSLNAAASAAVTDFLKPICPQTWTDRRWLWVTRGAVVGFGVLQIVVGLAAQVLTEAVINNVLTIASFTAGVLLGLFALGVLTRRVGQQAALVGLVAGVCVLTYVKFGTAVAFTWYALIGCASTFLVGLAASWLWPDRSHAIDA